MNSLKILVIDDEQLIRWSFEKQLTGKGFRIFTAETGEEGIQIAETQFPDIVFVDNHLPGIQGHDVISKIKALNEDVLIVFMTAYGSIDTAVKAMKLGASEYISKPFSFSEIYPIIENLRQKISMTNEVKLLRRQQRDIINFDRLVGNSGIMKRVIQDAKKIARIDSTTVLLLGESGTGKDFLANAIHNESPRKARSFVTINCSSLPESLLESELFGHEQGAFTDAKKLKKGLFEMADGGTVFLDEIGEINQAIQVKLLGVIENRKIKRVGGTTEIPVDIRIIAATNRDLLSSIQSGKFREDLYYRLKVFQILIPPLREHPEDIPGLVKHFITHFNSRFGKNVMDVDPQVTTLMLQYGWPGNIRELRNVVERAVILEAMNTLQADNLPNEITHSRSSSVQQDVSDSVTKEETKPSSPFGYSEIPLYELEKQSISRALEKTGNNQSKAARLLGITRDTLRYKVKKYKL